VTPETAQRILDERNKKNRPWKRTSLRKYTTDIANGSWRDNGETLSFYRNGVLANGQHRCKGSTLARGSFLTLIVTGLDPEVGTSIDTGSVRSPGDRALFRGVGKNQNIVGAAAKLLWVHENTGLSRMTNPDCQPTAMQVDEVVCTRPELEESARIASRLGKKFKTSVVCLCHCLFTPQDPFLAEKFFDDLNSGAGLKRGTATLTLRERVFVNAKSSSKIAQKETIALFFKAWMAYRDGKRCYQLSWSNVEPFPDIRR
jgi:hypothetical protein